MFFFFFFFFLAFHSPHFIFLSWMLKNFSLWIWLIIFLRNKWISHCQFCCQVGKMFILLSCWQTNLNEMLWGSFFRDFTLKLTIQETNSWSSHCIKNFVVGHLISNALSLNARFWRINGLLKLICLNWHFLWFFYDLIWNFTFYFNY